MLWKCDKTVERRISRAENGVKNISNNYLQTLASYSAWLINHGFLLFIELHTISFLFFHFIISIFYSVLLIHMVYPIYSGNGKTNQ